MYKTKLAIIGCGTQTRINYLPVTSACPKVQVVALVDSFLARARDLADEYSIELALNDYREIIGKVDAAIVCVPNFLHAPVAIDLLQGRTHVLVEKPMALNTCDCDKMIEAAGNADMVLAVGMHMRFFDPFRFIKQALEVGLLGDDIHFEFSAGVTQHWPALSDSLLFKENGGGLLADVGVHLLDLALWWLGDCDRLAYCDDARGGVETNCELHLWLRSGASGKVELSRTRRLRNTVKIEGNRGGLEAGVYNRLVRLKINDNAFALAGDVGNGPNGPLDAFHRQLEDFIEAIDTHREPFVSGREGRRAVELIETGYRSRRPLNYPWQSADSLVP